MGYFKVPKMHSWVVRLVLYLNKLARSIFSITVKFLGAYKGHERAKISPKKGPKHKIAYYEAKWNFKVPNVGQ